MPDPKFLDQLIPTIREAAATMAPQVPKGKDEAAEYLGKRLCHWFDRGSKAEDLVETGAALVGVAATAVWLLQLNLFEMTQQADQGKGPMADLMAHLVDHKLQN